MSATSTFIDTAASAGQQAAVLEFVDVVKTYGSGSNEVRAVKWLTQEQLLLRTGVGDHTTSLATVAAIMAALYFGLAGLLAAGMKLIHDSSAL